MKTELILFLRWVDSYTYILDGVRYYTTTDVIATTNELAELWELEFRRQHI